MCDKHKVLVFAGTTEGYAIAHFLEQHQVDVHACVATGYGAKGLKESRYLTCSHERLNAAQMAELIREKNITQIIDATHPYAVEVTGNIRKACEDTMKPYCRLVRESIQLGEQNNVVYVDSVEDAAAYLENTTGNVLLTTGSKDLRKFTAVTDYENRLYARVLSLPQVAADCAALGFEGSHLICMQGPFSAEMNRAMLKQYNCRYLVTKESGSRGGFLEKYEAAVDCGCQIVIIGRPKQEEGLSLKECKEWLCKEMKLRRHTKISLVGIGMGSEQSMTIEAQNACAKAELIIGGKRLADAAAKDGQDVYYEYNSRKIAQYIDEHPQYENVVIALSGDVGFYSGARKLLDVLGSETEVICGISSVAYFMSKIRKSWDNAAIVSAHGRECNLLHYIRTNETTFAILGTTDGVRTLAKKLQEYHMEQTILYVGENLSYDNEKILSGHPAEFTEYEADALSVVCVENLAPEAFARGIFDEQFLRAKVPMTKEEVRSVSLAKLKLHRDSVCYDVGAGTGSISIEMALEAYDGKVYAIEKKEEATELIHKNKIRFKADNLEIVQGLAPEALQDLPVPTHGFIGGSSGNLKEIMEALISKNPQVRIVINCITLETVTEALQCINKLSVKDVDVVQVSVSRSKVLGAYHMMMGENPIYVISCTGGEQL